MKLAIYFQVAELTNGKDPIPSVEEDQRLQPFPEKCREKDFMASYGYGEPSMM
jgi:hypothetical protein